MLLLNVANFLHNVACNMVWCCDGIFFYFSFLTLQWRIWHPLLIWRLCARPEARVPPDVRALAMPLIFLIWVCTNHVPLCSIAFHHASIHVVMKEKIMLPWITLFLFVDHVAPVRQSLSMHHHIFYWEWGFVTCVFLRAPDVKPRRCCRRKRIQPGRSTILWYRFPPPREAGSCKFLLTPMLSSQP
jgi:hypothetical protein